MTTPAIVLRRTGPMSEQEYLAIPEEIPWVEYIDGIAEEKCVGELEHGVLQAELTTVLTLYRRVHGGRTVNEARGRYRRPDDTSDYRVPDIAFYPAGSVARPEGERIMQPPPLAVEIRSREQSAASQRTKCRWYIARGVTECWLVDPLRRTFEVFDANRDGVEIATSSTYTTPLLPGFELNLPELFATLDD